jgi:hypothetical protein
VLICNIRLKLPLKDAKCGFSQFCLRLWMGLGAQNYAIAREILRNTESRKNGAFYDSVGISDSNQ